MIEIHGNAPSRDTMHFERSQSQGEWSLAGVLFVDTADSCSFCTETFTEVSMAIHARGLDTAFIERHWLAGLQAAAPAGRSVAKNKNNACQSQHSDALEQKISYRAHRGRPLREAWASVWATFSPI